MHGPRVSRAAGITWPFCRQAVAVSRLFWAAALPADEVSPRYHVERPMPHWAWTGSVSTAVIQDG